MPAIDRDLIAARGAELNAIVSLIREGIPAVVDDAGADSAEASHAGFDRAEAGAGTPLAGDQLAGAPFALKDIMAVAGTQTSVGSRVPVPVRAEVTAPVVRRLIAAGAVPVAKANCQEFSYGILGDESAFGRVVNPVDPQLCTGGSSSGSAALVAAGIVPLSVGSDTAGSVRVPAACCHVLGFKPTLGLVPTDGVVPLSETFDTVGFFTDTVERMRAVLEVFVPSNTEGTRADERSGGSSPSRVTEHAGGAAQPSKGLRVDTVRLSSGQRTAAEALAAVRAPDDVSTVFDELFPTADRLYAVIRKYEAFHAHRELIESHAPLFQPGVLAKLEAGREITDAEYASARAQLPGFRQDVLEQLAGVDIIATPAVHGPLRRWSEVGAKTSADYVRYSMPFNVLGWPAVTVPLGTTDAAGFPESIHLAAKPGCDRALLDAAEAILMTMPRGQS